MTVINYIRLIQYKSVFLLEILVPYDNIRIAKFEINPSTLSNRQSFCQPATILSWCISRDPLVHLQIHSNRHLGDLQVGELVIF